MFCLLTIMYYIIYYSCLYVFFDKFAILRRHVGAVPGAEILGL